MFYHRIGHERSQAQDHTMGGLRMGGLRGARLSSAPVLVGARTADMAQAIERYPFQIHTVRSGLIAWVLSGADVDDTMAWCEALKKAGVKGSVHIEPREPKRKSVAVRARQSLLGKGAELGLGLGFGSGRGTASCSWTRRVGASGANPDPNPNLNPNPNPNPNPSPNPHPHQVNTEHWNFDSFPWTCVTLFQLI